ncbi:hypothetical protein [Novosphingobium sp. BK352]|uniref:hypothetical protein n=1 Tax=Novosphingobium sp. BK352 TaxID=2587106 RepID=UPI001621EB0B|nr:hypothetical protein [Novosphingobium sp. BK352]
MTRIHSSMGETAFPASALTIALYATVYQIFALALLRCGRQKGRAFQASSPKLSKGRPSGAAFFFVWFCRAKGRVLFLGSMARGPANDHRGEAEPGGMWQQSRMVQAQAKKYNERG